MDKSIRMDTTLTAPFAHARTMLSHTENALDEASDCCEGAEAAQLEAMRDDVAAITRRFDDLVQAAIDRAAQADDPHERAAARARNTDFADTGGKDWT